jgi:phosphoenolpyruvate synthase/pyruvate phosphate dikinase
MPDYLSLDAASERRSAVARENAFGFYIGADHIIRITLETMFPDIAPLVGFITLDEAVAHKIPPQEIIQARAQHFIYYQDQVITDRSFYDLCRQESFRIESIYSPLRKEIRGLVGAGGAARGSAYLCTSDPERVHFSTGDILIAHDIEERDLPLVERASAVILDRGSYYGRATILLRALKKPCIFNARIATLVLQSGDRLEVDGDGGVIRLMSSLT